MGLKGLSDKSWGGGLGTRLHAGMVSNTIRFGYLWPGSGILVLCKQGIRANSLNRGSKNLHSWLTKKTLAGAR